MKLLKFLLIFCICSGYLLSTGSSDIAIKKLIKIEGEDNQIYRCMDLTTDNSHNIYITDASVLPSNIGESPQGTIMAFASEIMARHLKG